MGGSGYYAPNGVNGWALARRDLAQAVYDTILSQLRLQAAVGRLVKADLLEINELLDRSGR